jgi:hypothetical protein
VLSPVICIPGTAVDPPGFLANIEEDVHDFSGESLDQWNGDRRLCRAQLSGV